MTVLSFPEAVLQVQEEAREKIAAWPWDMDLGKPFGDVNGPVMAVVQHSSTAALSEQNDLSRYKEDKINPSHYKRHGVECIEMTENMGFLDGNVVKYIYRYAMKGGIEDLDKADWYLQRLRAKVRG